MDPSAPGFYVTVVTLSFTAIAGLAVSLRLFTRLAVVRKGGLEDVLIALSAVCIHLKVASNSDSTNTS